MAAFSPRQVFAAPMNVPKTHFAGHHLTALRSIVRMLKTVDLVVEVRDARAPMTSRNPLFEKAFIRHPRLIIYNKRDVSGPVDSQLLNPLKETAPIISTSITDRSDVSKVLEHITELAKANASGHDFKVLVTGVPNVGKSTLLNALRSQGLHRAVTGAQPGVTRSLGTRVKIWEDPPVYLLDTPGVMTPYVPNAMAMLKLALVACVSEKLFDTVILADFLLYTLNQRDPSVYKEWSEATNDVDDLLEKTARKTGRLAKQGAVEQESAARFLLHRYREGKFGHFCLDKVAECSEMEQIWKSQFKQYQHLLTKSR